MRKSLILFSILLFGLLFSVASFAAQTKVFGPKTVGVGRTQTTTYIGTFKGFFDGALGSLTITNGFGDNIPTTPCTGTKKEIKNCNKLRAAALYFMPDSVEVWINNHRGRKWANPKNSRRCYFCLCCQYNKSDQS